MQRIKRMNSKKKTIVRMVAVLVGSMLLFMSACTGEASTQTSDILTQKEIDEARMPITVLVKYAFSINTFEAAVEEKFPDIDIVQVGNYTRKMGIDEYDSRLKNDDIPDVVMTWPLDVGEEYWEERLLDLSGYNFTSNYNLSMLNNVSRDGKLYYLPGPSQVRGIVYNKTLFEENGWKVPQNYDEFVTLCQTIEQSGIRSLQLGLGNAEVLDTAFVGYSYAKCFWQSSDSQWIREYNEGQHSFGDHFGPALDIYQGLIDDGILQKQDLDITYAKRETMLFTRQCAMVEDSVLLARMGEQLTGTTDEFALMPFFNPEDGGDWARLYMVCYIGLNKHLADKGNEEKFEKVLSLMEYISTLEGQEALMGDTGAMFSSLTGKKPSDVPEIEHLLPALENGRYAIFPELKNAQGALREGLAGMLRGDTTKEEVIAMVDAQNVEPKNEVTQEILGTATEDFSLTATGNFITDSMREQSGADIALFLDNGKDGRYNGRGVSAKLYQGEITAADIERVLPDLKHEETGTLWEVTMTGKDLVNTLEYSIAVDNNLSGWFYYFSGLHMTYDPVAEPGKRISKLTTEDGKPIEEDKIYSIAVMDETVPEEFMITCEKTGITIADILRNSILGQGEITPSADERFLVPNP